VFAGDRRPPRNRRDRTWTDGYGHSVGLGNLSATVFGNGNKNTAIGRNNTVGTVGTPGVVLNGTTVLASTGNGNKNTAIGKNNTAASILGSANKTHVFGRNSAATVTGLNNQTIKVKGNNKTSTAP
jgi:hypothetical protein